MRIIIDGAGEVGSHLARLLSNEEQDITVIDSDRVKLDHLDSTLNLMTVNGANTSFTALREARADKADLFIAVTPFETDNIVACSIAQSLGAKRTVARIDNFNFMADENRRFINQLGVNELIYPEYLAAQQIMVSLGKSWVRHWFELHDGEIIVVGVRLRDGAPIVGMQLKEFSFTNHNFHVSAIKRNHETIIPRGDDRLLAGDILYITTTRQHAEELLKLCGKTQQKIRKVLVVGGSKIAIRLADLATDKYRIKILDNDPKVVESLAEKCPDCEVLFGDGRDVETLIDAGIGDTDAFIALTDSSEANILACLTAKEFGVKKTIAEVESLQFIAQAENLGIGTTINKKLLASSTIFQILLDADTSSSKCLALTDAEVAELEVKPGSKITKAPVKDLSLSHNMTLAGLIRDGKGMLVNGNTRIEAGDHVVVFCLYGSIHKVERLFN